MENDYDLVIPGFPNLVSSGVIKCAESLTLNISEPVRGDSPRPGLHTGPALLTKTPLRSSRDTGR